MYCRKLQLTYFQGWKKKSVVCKQKCDKKPGVQEFCVGYSVGGVKLDGFALGTVILACSGSSYGRRVGGKGYWYWEQRRKSSTHLEHWKSAISIEARKG